MNGFCLASKRCRGFFVECWWEGGRGDGEGIRMIARSRNGVPYI